MENSASIKNASESTTAEEENYSLVELFEEMRDTYNNQGYVQPELFCPNSGSVS